MENFYNSFRNIHSLEYFYNKINKHYILNNILFLKIIEQVFDGPIILTFYSKDFYIYKYLKKQEPSQVYKTFVDENEEEIWCIDHHREKLYFFAKIFREK